MQTGMVASDIEEVSSLTRRQQDLVAELKGMIEPIGLHPLDIPNQDLQVLDFLGAARVVGLGEATHETSEFFAMKHRVFTYLVERFDFRAFGFEADFSVSVTLDRYVTTGERNLFHLMTNKMGFWCWKNREVYDLLQWMRYYNQGRSLSRRLRYFGLDCQDAQLAEYLSKKRTWDVAV